MNTAAYIIARASEWEPADWAIIGGIFATAVGALSAAIVAIIKAARGEAKTDLANDRISNVSRAQDTMRSDLTTVASNTTPPTAATTSTPVPVALVEAKPDAVVTTQPPPKP